MRQQRIERAARTISRMLVNRYDWAGWQPKLDDVAIDYVAINYPPTRLGAPA